ncbi:hypothetical protein [Streptococcus himalayensis]|nr:hypothetical protein [Streptococcus himalayensis]
MKIYKNNDIHNIIDQVSDLYDTIYCDERQETHFLKKEWREA